MPSIKEKMAVVAPMPRANVRTTVRAKAGVFRSWRNAKRRSRASACIYSPQPLRLVINSDTKSRERSGPIFQEQMCLAVKESRPFGRHAGSQSLPSIARFGNGQVAILDPIVWNCSRAVGVTNDNRQIKRGIRQHSLWRH